MFHNRRWIVLAALTAAAPSFLRAQGTDTTNAMRQGVYGSIGIGYGIARPGADLSGTVQWENESGVTYYVAAGLSLNPHLRLGLEWNYFRTDGAFKSFIPVGITATTMFFSAAVAYYPSLTTNFWIKGDIGYANLIGSQSGLHATEGGLAGGIGVGYDWRMGQSNFAIIPFANYFQQFSPGEFGGVLQGTGDSGTTRLFQIGVGAGYQH